MRGRLTALWRYPVKSMLDAPLAAVDVTADGLAGDRRLALVHAQVVSAGRVRLGDTVRVG